MSKGQNFLQRFMQKHTPFRSLADAATLGYTDFDKKGDSNYQKGIKRGIAGFGDLVTENQYDFDKRGTNAQLRAREINEFNRELGNPRGDQYSRDFRDMLGTNMALREFELAREGQRMKSLARDMAEMTDVYSQTAADRRLMEDRFSPTKISQQRLRAQQGEAALMNAIANQGTTAAQIGSIGTSRRFGGGARG